MKIVHVPLDERPCNYDFPYEIFNDDNFKVVRVPFKFMGLKKKSGDITSINNFVYSECQDADALVLSIDTLLYGGIVPSRLHFYDFSKVNEKLQKIRLIKQNNPKIKIYAFSLIMRCPQYDDDDEEPAYYLTYGRRIFRQKFIWHRMQLNIATKEEIEEYNSINIPQEYLLDYASRREVNTNITIEAVKLVKDGIIDFLIVPQDDSAPFGYTALDQQKVRNEITLNNLELKVLSYPGADEVSHTLFSRLLNEYYHKKPLVFLKYPSEKCKSVYPCAEDRILDVSARYQIIAAGGLVASSYSEAQLVFAINAPSDKMISSQFREYIGNEYHVYRNLNEFVCFIEKCVADGKAVTIGDVGYCNGGDLELITLIEQKNLYLKIQGYASWNIPCNSLGTALAMGMKSLYSFDAKRFKTFLLHRFVEDVGYCTLARKILREDYCEQNGYTIYDTKGQRGPFANYTKTLINEQVKLFMPSIASLYTIDDIYMPWSRTYEVGLHISLKEN